MGRDEILLVFYRMLLNVNHSYEDFLKEEGILEASTSTAVKKGAGLADHRSDGHPISQAAKGAGSSPRR